MTSEESLAKYLDAYQLTPVPRAGCLELDTEGQPAEATAREIIGHFGLSTA